MPDSSRLSHVLEHGIRGPARVPCLVGRGVCAELRARCGIGAGRVPRTRHGDRDRSVVPLGPGRGARALRVGLRASARARSRAAHGTLRARPLHHTPERRAAQKRAVPRCAVPRCATPRSARPGRGPLGGTGARGARGAERAGQGRKVVEAAGIEPASWNSPTHGVDVRVSRFGSRRLLARERALVRPTPVFLAALPRGTGTRPVRWMTFAPGRGHSRRKRRPDFGSGSECVVVGRLCRSRDVDGVTRGPRHATAGSVEPVETSAPPQAFRPRAS